ncbi:polyunsaturated fatty acid lipoxygenase ALOX15B-like [Alosa pseudoharengus]|uniref:polyunsaturated fatty acid lipoxygenase ALOX15B-like n=1 Tax=Alosa pseudoharengus TaxID=34774 RepID=UPI003F8ACD43
MVSYTVTAHTGNRLLSGTTSRVCIQLRGTDAESDEESLNRFQGFWQGSVRTFRVCCKESVGELISIKLCLKPFMGYYIEWFCDKISVRTPEGNDILFPCYRWVGCDENIVLRPAKASLTFQDTHPIAQRQRMRHLQEHRETFRWRVYAEGMPQCVDFDTSLALPAEVQFSFTKATDFFTSAGKQLSALKLTGLADCRRSWESINQLDVIICENKNSTIGYVEDHWDEDEFFGYQFLNGLNPMVIKRCSKLPGNFPVTEEMVKHYMRGCTLEQEMKKGNIFLCDYKMLDGLVGNVVAGRQQYLTAPLVLLYCNPQGLMLPIAIQLKQKPGQDNPIFLPSDSKSDWQLAKLFVRNAEFSVHEVDFHLLRTHLLAEVFTVATLRNLPSPHPLFKLLYPHIRYTLHINILARNQLISEDGVINIYAGVGGESLQKLLRRATTALTYRSLCLPENISERGLENVPNYYYRDDGIKLWNVINKLVERFLTHYYECDANVQADTELHSWISDIFTHGFLARESSGVPSSFQTVAELVKFVTMAIFTVSGQHASVNNGQFDYGGWMPNFPFALRKPPPKEKGQTTEATILETLPDVGTTVNIMAFLRLLSTKSQDHYPLGCIPEDMYDAAVPCNLIEDFQKDLKELSALIEERNKKLELPYTYLNPENVDNSVAI